MSDIKHARVMSFNLPRAILFGYKPTKLDRMIGWRSDHKHTELQFSTRYGGISFSCTMADGVGGCRFKMIKYSHPEYWDAVYVPVTVEQEAKMWAKAMAMSDTGGCVKFPHGLVWALEHDDPKAHSECHYGPNHVKYDRGGAAFSYWTKWDIYKPSKKKRVCCRAVTEVVLAGYPLAMDISIPTWKSEDGRTGYYDTSDYASMTPSEIDGMMRNYFSIDGILSRVKL